MIQREYKSPDLQTQFEIFLYVFVLYYNTVNGEDIFLNVNFQMNVTLTEGLLFTAQISHQSLMLQFLSCL